MKIIIDHDGVKREITGPFSLCLDRDMLHQIVRELQSADEDKGEGGFTYGWVEIPQRPKNTINTPPSPWK